MPHLDLDDFRPEPHSITFRGVDYGLPGQIPVPTVLRAVQLEQQMRVAEDNEQAAAKTLRDVLADHAEDSDEAKAAIAAYQKAADDPAWEAAITETYAIVMELLRDENMEVPDLRLSAQECNAILAMIKTGRAPAKQTVQSGRALAEAVAEEVGIDISDPDAQEGSSGLAAVGGGQGSGEAAEGASGPPTRSQRRPRTTSGSRSGPRTRSPKSSSE